MGGVGSAILEFLAREKILEIEVVSFEYEDSFINHGNTKIVEESLGILPEQLAKVINL
jgi:1-deoxy-D-xylulose-5-phosphate synthase